PASSAWPVPTETTFTAMPVFCLKIGNRWLGKPVSCASVVEATAIDFSCAIACPAKKVPKIAMNANVVFRSESKLEPHQCRYKNNTQPVTVLRLTETLVQCPLLALSRHPCLRCTCPLSGSKQT